MIDYYPLLRRTVVALDSSDAETRRRVYERAWSAARDKWRKLDPAPTEAQIRAEFAALKDAIARVEEEFSEALAPPADSPAQPASAEPPLATLANEAPIAPPTPNTDPAPDSRRVYVPPPSSMAESRTATPRWVKWAAAGAIVIAAAVFGTAAVIQHGGQRPDETSSVQAAGQPQRPAPRANAAYVFTRQPVYYRTTHPVGTVVIDKAQWFVYVIQPNVVALRYGLAIGPECGDVAGLRTVAAKHDLTSLPPPEGLTEDRRYLLLDPGTLRLNATSDPAEIGRAAPDGCFRVSAEDVGDLFARVRVGTNVVVGH